MKQELRDYFDRHLDAVMEKMPLRVHELLAEVPMYIEDHPEESLLRKMGYRQRDHLCGLYTGIPLTQKSVMQSGVLSDVIHLYREGILRMATERGGRIDERELRKQIRITVLHDLGHYHGLDEDELQELASG